MGCCTFNNQDSKQLYSIRYGEMETRSGSTDTQPLELFEQQLEQLDQIRAKMKALINTYDFSEEEYLQTCQSFLQRYFQYLQISHEKKYIQDNIIIENILKQRNFVESILSSFEISQTEYIQWFNEYLVQLKGLEQNSGIMGEFQQAIAKECNLISILSVLLNFTEEQVEFHQVWLQKEISSMKERLLSYSQKLIFEHAQQSIKFLEQNNLYDNLLQLKQEKSIKQVEFWGYKLLQQLVELKADHHESIWNTEFLNMAIELEKHYTTLYLERIINPYQLLMDDYLIQEEIELASMALILEGFEMKKMEIFQEDFYVFHIHQAEKCILQMQKLSNNFDNYFTKYQLQHFKKQKVELDAVLKDCQGYYQLSMKKVSSMIAGEVDEYFQRSDCMKIILNTEKRQERKLQVFISMYGGKVVSDIRELKKNSQKFLDLEGLRLNHNTMEVKQLIIDYDMNFKQLQSLYLKWVNEQIDLEKGELQKNENSDAQQKIDSMIKQTDIYINQAKCISIAEKEIEKLQEKVLQLLDSVIFTKDKKKRASQLSEYALKLKQERTSALNSPQSVKEKGFSKIMNKKIAIFQQLKASTNLPTIKLKRLPLKIISQCGKCNAQPAFQVKHELCQTNYYLDMYGYIRCEKRLISAPKEKSCKLKYIMDQQFICPYCKSKFYLTKFYKFLQAIVKGIELSELAIDSKDILQLYKKIYDDFSKIYYQFMLKKLDMGDNATDESQENQN